MRNSVLLYHLSSIWLPHIYKKWHSRELPASLSSSGIVPKCVWTWVTAGEGKAPHTFSSLILLLCLMSACLGSDGGLPALSLSYSFIPPSSILPSLVHLFLHFLLADHFAPPPHTGWFSLSALRLSWLLFVSWGRVLSVSSLLPHPSHRFRWKDPPVEEREGGGGTLTYNRTIFV